MSRTVTSNLKGKVGLETVSNDFRVVTRPETGSMEKNEAWPDPKTESDIENRRSEKDPVSLSCAFKSDSKILPKS